eukprot:5042274-Pleurochrysis_carterae.AAC.1
MRARARALVRALALVFACANGYACACVCARARGHASPLHTDWVWAAYTHTPQRQGVRTQHGVHLCMFS